MSIQPKVVLFRKSSTIISKAIAHVTGSDITHSAVLVNGSLYDSSETRGKFARANIKKLKKRKVEVYPLGASPDQVNAWLAHHLERRYDYAGILGWMVYSLVGRFFSTSKLNAQSKVYCFEATARLVADVQGLKFRTHLSGQDLKRVLGAPTYIGSLGDYYEEFVGPIPKRS